MPPRIKPRISGRWRRHATSPPHTAAKNMYVRSRNSSGLGSVFYTVGEGQGFGRGRNPLDGPNVFPTPLYVVRDLPPLPGYNAPSDCGPSSPLTGGSSQG